MTLPIFELLEDAISILLEDGVVQLFNVFDPVVLSTISADIFKLSNSERLPTSIRSFKANSVDSYTLFDENDGMPLIDDMMLEISSGNIQKIWNPQNCHTEFVDAICPMFDLISNTIFYGMIRKEVSFILPPGRAIIPKEIHRTSNFGSGINYSIILFIEPDVNNTHLYSYILGSHRLCTCELNPCKCRQLDVGNKISFSSPIMPFPQSPGSMLVVNDACLSNVSICTPTTSGCVFIKKICL